MTSKKSCITSITLIFLLTVVMIASVKPANAESNVIITSDSGYLSPDAAYYIYGEVQNVGDTTVRFVKITATYYDSSDSLIVTDWGYSDLDVLTPNAKSGFCVVLMEDAAELEKVDHYTLALTYSEAPSTPQQALTIQSHFGYVSNSGALRISGEITNNGDSESTYTIIYATFYDSQGKVVVTDLTFPEPEDMPAGATESFEVFYPDFDNRVPLIASYRLTAESYDYAITASVTGTITAAPTATPDSTTNPTTSAQEPTPTPTIPEYPIETAIIALIIATFCSMLFLKGKIGKKQ